MADITICDHGCSSVDGCAGKCQAPPLVDTVMDDSDNARLIAAASALLAAAKAVSAEYDDVEAGQAASNALDALQSAIRRAEGLPSDALAKSSSRGVG